MTDVWIEIGHYREWHAVKLLSNTEDTKQILSIRSKIEHYIPAMFRQTTDVQ